jgi:hypothetical protein
MGGFATRRGYLALSLASACSAKPTAAPLSPVRSAATAPEAGSVPAAAPTAGTPFYVGPADFVGVTASIDLPAPPSGRSLVFITPALGTRSSRPRRGLEGEDLAVRIAVEASTGAGSSTTGHPLPAPRHLTVAAATPHPTRPAEGLAAQRNFKIYARATRTFVDATGALAYVGARYAFYEDAKNQKNFTPEEYATIDARADDDYGALVDVFGPPLDLHHNGRVVVFVSRTFAGSHPTAQASTGYCSPDDTEIGCDLLSNVISFWSLDGFADAEARRDFYVRHYYPRTLLHETIHLCQYQAAVDHRHVSFSAPSYLREGQAMLMRFIRPHDDIDWAELSSLVNRLGPEGTPLGSPYAMGGLFAWWMHQRYGPSVERALMNAEADEDLVDPVAEATGTPEPLALAEFYATLSLDGTAYGHESGLEFGVEHIGAQIRHVPLEPVHVGETREATVVATGRAAFEVDHQEAVRLTAETFPGKAYVLVLSPR